MQLPKTYAVFFLPDIGWNNAPRRSVPKHLLVACPRIKIDEGDDEYLSDRIEQHYNYDIDSLEAIEVTPSRFKNMSSGERQQMKNAPLLFVKPDDSVRLVDKHDMITERTKAKAIDVAMTQNKELMERLAKR